MNFKISVILLVSAMSCSSAAEKRCVHRFPDKCDPDYCSRVRLACCPKTEDSCKGRYVKQNECDCCQTKFISYKECRDTGAITKCANVEDNCNGVVLKRGDSHCDLCPRCVPYPELKYYC
ncbi:hypothetical protein GE061_016127 [Apolygus lucorum]|uniref:Antistasin-like domain-containing protein n=1 Tax=Apolygus lucorum TaxID=248454 RepID=A0A8S9XF53_APOLU|nr:hypothetical protein GE061_016127 [Apolygus lucorum]